MGTYEKCTVPIVVERFCPAPKFTSAHKSFLDSSSRLSVRTPAFLQLLSAALRPSEATSQEWGQLNTQRHSSNFDQSGSIPATWVANENVLGAWQLSAPQTHIYFQWPHLDS